MRHLPVPVNSLKIENKNNVQDKGQQKLKKNNVDKVGSPAERGLWGAQPLGMQGFESAAPKVQGVRGA